VARQWTEFCKKKKTIRMKSHHTDVFVVIFRQANNNFNSDLSIPISISSNAPLENCRFKKKEDFYL
jgi:hypothetical protein